MQESDIQAFMRLQRKDWLDMVEREGLAPVAMQQADEEGEPPCPACGTAAPLIEGACSDCGLQLA